MLLLIDGYNLLYQSDLLGRGRGERWLQQARDRLVQQLLQRLDAALAVQTVLVFDAASPPPHLPNRYTLAGLQVLYAVGYPEADDLLEELIARHPTPRRLAVVSSDHRVQRAARRRRAATFEADAWYARFIERGPQLAVPWPPAARAQAAGDENAPTAPEKPLAPVDADAVQQWMDAFLLGRPAAPEPAPRPADLAPPSDAPPPPSDAPPPPSDAPPLPSGRPDAPSQTSVARRAETPTPTPTTFKQKTPSTPKPKPKPKQEQEPKQNASSTPEQSRSSPPKQQASKSKGKTGEPGQASAQRSLRSPPRRKSKPPSDGRSRRQRQEPPDRSRRQLDPHSDDPFPEGYGNDLLE